MAVGVILKVGATGIEQVAKQFDKVDGSVKKLGMNGKRMASVLGRDISGLIPKFGALSMAIGGIGAIGAGKKVMGFNRMLAQIKADAGMSEGEIQKLKTAIEGMAGSTGIMSGEIAGAYRVFMDFGGQMGLAKDIMSDLTLFSKATGTAMDEAATIAATLGGNLKMSKEEIVGALSSMNELGKAGQMALKDVSANLPQILASGAGRGFTGARAVTQMGAAHQIIAKSYGTGTEASNMARTSLDALMRDLTAKVKPLKKLGISVFDSKGSMHDLDKIMAQILSKTKGDPVKLSKIFSAESQKAAAAFVDVTNRSMLSPDVKKMFSVSGTRGDLEKSYKAVTTGIGESAAKFDTAAAKMESALQEHGAKLLGFIGNDPTKILTMAGGAYLGIKLAPTIGKLLLGQSLLGKTAIGGAAQKVLGGLTGNANATPVKVVNWPSELGGKSIGAVAGTEAVAEVITKNAGALKTIGGIVGAAVVGYGVGTLIDHYTGASDKISDWAVGGQREAAKGRMAQYEQDLQKNSLAKQARALAELGSKGIKNADVRGVGNIKLTGDAIAEAIMKKADKLGLGGEESKLLLQQIINVIRDQKLTVTTNNGLDNPKVQLSRGSRK